MVPPEIKCFFIIGKINKQFAAGYKSGTRNESNEIRVAIRGSREVAV